MAWNQPGSSNNNPWGKKPSSGGDLDQAFKDWQKRVQSLFGGGQSSTPVLIFVTVVLAVWAATGFYTVPPGSQGVVQRFGAYYQTVPNGYGWRFPWPIESVTKVKDGLWKFAARVQYNKKDVKVALNVPVFFAGDTPVISLTRQAVTGLGTFDTRLVIYKGGYAGTWGGGDHGGAMFGKIVKNDAPDSKP